MPVPEPGRAEVSAAATTFETDLAAALAARDAPRVAVDVLVPADPYLDTAGESLRRRIFLTRGESGEDLCLRPDFTIPVCLRHIEAQGVLPRRYSYLGLVFRQHRRERETEFRQAGIEDLGEPDVAAADARALADALAALATCGLAGDLTTLVGDQALFEAFLAALGLPAGWQRRLIRTFGDDVQLASALTRLSRPAEDRLAGLEPELHTLARAGDRGGLSAIVRERMEEGGLSPHAGRDPGEIAARLIEKVAIAEARLDAAALARLKAFLAIDCSLAAAGGELRRLAAESGVDFGRALAQFEARNAALAAAGVDLAALDYRAAFGRPLDYYTGFVFEIRPRAGGEVLAGGGRYDRLLTYLGARVPVPAVGFSLWLDRIEAIGGGTP